jgi:hypothetical protein
MLLGGVWLVVGGNQIAAMELGEFSMAANGHGLVAQYIAFVILEPSFRAAR